MDFENDKLQWLEYDLLKNEPSISAYTYLRHGGASEKPFFSLNLSSQVGDNPESVKANRNLIQNHLDVDKVIFANQTHSDLVEEVTLSNMDKNFNCDALVTQEKSIGLAIAHADCQAIIFFDPENYVVAAVHAGWKGLVKNIYKSCITYMMDNFHSKPENIIALISPSLGPNHSQFNNYKKELPKSFWSYKKEDKNFDLWQIAIDQLKDLGLLEKNIELAGICTYSNNEDYFSFRKSKDTGRNVTVVCLN